MRMVSRTGRWLGGRAWGVGPSLWLVDSYADWLRGRSDEQLRTLLSARPELISPVPADLAGLAARAATSAAASRALDRLDRFTLAILEALLVRFGFALYAGRPTPENAPVRLPARLTR